MSGVGGMKRSGRSSKKKGKLSKASGCYAGTVLGETREKKRYLKLTDGGETG